MELLSLENQFDYGATNLDQSMPPACVKDIRDTATPFSLMRFSLKSKTNNTTCGEQVDQDGEVVDVFLQKRRNANAAKRFFKRILQKHKGELRKIVTDKLRSASRLDS